MTMTTAFQRMMFRILRSISGSPGYSGCASTSMVLMYGVFCLNVMGAP